MVKVAQQLNLAETAVGVLQVVERILYLKQRRVSQLSSHHAESRGRRSRSDLFDCHFLVRLIIQGAADLGIGAAADGLQGLVLCVHGKR